MGKRRVSRLAVSRATRRAPLSTAYSITIIRRRRQPRPAQVQWPTPLPTPAIPRAHSTSYCKRPRAITIRQQRPTLGARRQAALPAASQRAISPAPRRSTSSSSRAPLAPATQVRRRRPAGSSSKRSNRLQRQIIHPAAPPPALAPAFRRPPCPPARRRPEVKPQARRLFPAPRSRTTSSSSSKLGTQCLVAAAAVAEVALARWRRRRRPARQMVNMIDSDPLRRAATTNKSPPNDSHSFSTGHTLLHSPTQLARCHLSHSGPFSLSHSRPTKTSKLAPNYFMLTLAGRRRKKN